MIHVEKLTKTFRNPVKEPGIVGTLRSFVKPQHRIITAVDSFSVEIARGEFVGLLGPNGAGKTTLMKMLTGIIEPSRGEVSVLGERPFERKKDFRKRIALVMGQKSQLWWDIPAMDSFQLLQAYYEIDPNIFSRRVSELSEILGVMPLLKTHIRKLSLGERMKMELMACLLHDPDVVFLDEPTIGLDLVAQRNIRRFLRDYQRKTGATVILTSHYMADVTALCSRIVLILDGQKRFDGSIEAFSNILGMDKHVEIAFIESVDPSHEVFAGLEATWDEAYRSVSLRIAEMDVAQRTAAILSALPVSDFHTEKLAIERVMETLLARPELLQAPSS